MQVDEYRALDATALADCIASGEVSRTEVVDAAIACADAHNPRLNAIVTPMYESARAHAEHATGPLAGVPFLVKDLNYVAGVRCTFGSRLWSGFVPDHDAEIVRRHRAAGLVILGKSNTPEVGLAATTESTFLGACHNPYDLARTPGGSSGGAAAAVAAGIVPVAHATDGGGSIRIPASCCGLVGLKPTRGRTPLGPDVGEGWGGMSVGHVVSRSVRDSAWLLDLTHGPAPGDPHHAPHFAGRFRDALAIDPAPMRVAVDLVPVSGSPVHPQCVEAVHGAARLLESLGHHVEEASPAFDRDTFTLATDTLVIANVANQVLRRCETLGIEPSAAVIERHTLRLVQAGRNLGADLYPRALNHIHAVGRHMAGFHETYDLVLSPTLLQPPVPLGYMDADNDDAATYVEHFRSFWGFTNLCNATGAPAISLPLHRTPEGLPVGVQLAAAFGNEYGLLAVAAQIERAVGGFGDRP